MNARRKAKKNAARNWLQPGGRHRWQISHYAVEKSEELGGLMVEKFEMVRHAPSRHGRPTGPSQETRISLWAGGTSTGKTPLILP